MDNNEIEELMRKAIGETAPLKVKHFNNIDMDEPIRDLPVDSVEVMELVGYIEEDIGKIFPDDELAKINTLNDLAMLIIKYSA